MRKLFICIICSFLITVSAFAAPGTTYGPTTADDTLWHIASELRPNNDVSVQQVMLAIFCLNEDAFYANNINAIETGKIIKFPSLDKICSLSREQAYFEVEKQDRQWKRANLKHSKQLIKHKKSVKKSKKATTTSSEQSESPLTETVSSAQAEQQLAETAPEQTVQQPAETVPQTMPPAQAEQTAQQLAETALQTMYPEQAAPQTVATNALQPPATPASNETVTPLAQVQEIAPAAEASVVTAKMIQFDEKINSIEQSVEQLKKYILENKKSSQNSFNISFKPVQQYIDGLAARLGQPLFTILLVCVIVLLLLILLCLSVRRRKRYDAAKFLSPNANPHEEECDFMEGKEGVAAKLNLARAYIDMGKEAEAHVMLDEVLAKGSASEQEKAKELLAEIKKS